MKVSTSDDSEELQRLIALSELDKEEQEIRERKQALREEIRQVKKRKFFDFVGANEGVDSISM